MMRKQIAAANWKMNCGISEARELLEKLSGFQGELTDPQEVILAVPFPYLLMATEIAGGRKGFFIAAQNCHTEDYGAFTGEVSAPMLASCGVHHVIIGHSERRKYFGETNQILTEKVLQALKNDIIPIFCCGESLEIREKGNQNEFVAQQISESLFGLNPEQISKIILAYEPIWAIGTGKTATSSQAQEMHAHIRACISEKYGSSVADGISILYGGSVKPDNAQEIFSEADVDGGLVGGASLKADQFIRIIDGLKK